jgi:LacI family transcriptional regulator
MTTIRDVARAAGVSIATVSRVFNGSTRVSDETSKRVRTAAARLDYWPNEAARSLTTSRTHALGILLPDLYGEFFSEVIRGIDHAARRERYQILVSSSHADTETLVAVARSLRGRVDGLIVMAPDEGTAAAISQMKGNFPVVLLTPRFEVKTCSTISIANFEGAYGMVKHLMKVGHRLIATVKGPSGNVDAEERLRGFRAALHEAGRETPGELEFQGDFTESSGYRCAKRILRCLPRPTAVFAANDYMAVGLMSALGEAGLHVPQDVAVTGFDDIAIAQYLNPPLTTVRVDAYELGEQAVRQWIYSTRSGRQVPAHHLLPANLIVRSSCGSTEPLAMDLRPRHRSRTPEMTADDPHPDPAAPSAEETVRTTPGRTVE